MPHWAHTIGLRREIFLMSSRTAIAAILSAMLAGMLKLPEFYWAPISTIVILLSATDQQALAWQRFAGTAMGAALGALIATFLHPNLAIYGLGLFVCGFLCTILRIGTAYRFAAITLTIILLIAHTRPPWVVGLHRFVEVSLGIAVALAVARVWPLPQISAS